MDKQKSCPFCEQLARIRDDFECEVRPADVVSFSAGLVSHSKSAVVSHFDVALHFCPHCGRKFDEAEVADIVFDD